MVKFCFPFLSHLFLIHLLLACFDVAATNITTDHLALLAFKDKINLQPSHFLATNWSSASFVCEWMGITCGSRHHRVTALNISNMNLIGIIPPQLGNLSFLVSLDLSKNKFYGNLPDDLAHLDRLKVLNLRGNNFSGEIPSSLGSLHRLRIFLLKRNSFTGFIPPFIFNISKLEELRLSFNSLQGSIPIEIGNLHSLKILAIGHNQLSGAIPQELGRLSKLKEFFLSNNSLTGFIPKEIVNLTMLRTLDSSYNYLTGIIPQEFDNLQNLERISLAYNNLFGPIPVGIFNLSMIRLINIGRNNLSGNLPSSMGYGLPNLEKLYLYTNALSGPIPHSISNCSKLTLIEISENKLSGFIANSLGNLRFLKWLNLNSNNLMSNSLSPELSFIDSLVNCRYLTHLGLSDNPLNGILPSSFGNLSTSIKEIYLGKCNIKGKIPNSVGNLSSLYSLSMIRNHLIGSVPSSIQGIHGLQMLNLKDNNLVSKVSLVNLCKIGSLYAVDLSQNKISGSIPECLGNVTSLRHLYLGSNGLDSSIPTEFWNLKDLLRLNLSSNSLSGSLPLEVGGLKAATILDLSMNQISGGIPTSIRSLQSLEYLHLGGNKLEGSIPESIGMMLSLELLNLSHNSLSGSIPRSLEKLQHLEYFDVSFNHLSGEIPFGGPFENFTSASFDSNEALCGRSEFHVSPCHTMLGKRKHLRTIFILLVVGAIIGAILLGFVYLRCQKKEKVPNTTDVLSVRTQDRISYYELLQATDGYSESNLLGTGSFGSVYKGILNDGRTLAVKVFNLQEERALNSFEAECQILRSLRHRNLVKVITSCSNPDFKALVLEFMPNGNLDKWLYSHNNFLDIVQRLSIMIDVACALQYLHHSNPMPVVHCDIKPSNVLLDQDMVAHVSDFGIARLLAQSSIAFTNTLATLGYISPEYGLEGLVSTRSDVYSYGIMLMEVFTRKKPSDDMFNESFSLRGSILASMPDALVEVLDSNLLRPGEEYFTEKLECLSSIMKVAMNCTRESPRERSNMDNVVTTLTKIKVQLLPYHRRA